MAASKAARACGVPCSACFEVAQLLAILDWLGVAKPLVFGRDVGAVVALAFKVRLLIRVGVIVRKRCVFLAILLIRSALQAVL